MEARKLQQEQGQTESENTGLAVGRGGNVSSTFAQLLLLFVVTLRRRLKVVS